MDFQTPFTKEASKEFEKHVNFDQEVIVITSCKGKNVKRWPVPMTNRLKRQLLKLQLRLKHNNPDALVFEGREGQPA